MNRSRGLRFLLFGGLAVLLLVGGLTLTVLAGRMRTPEKIAGPRQIKTGAPSATPVPPTSIPIVIDAAVPLPPGLPAPGVQPVKSPNGGWEPKALPTDSVDVNRVKAAIEAAAKGWGVPGKFHVNSLWQVTEDLQIASGYYSGPLAPGIVTLPTMGQAQFVGLPKWGGGGPATIYGVKGDLVLIQMGSNYLVYDYRSGKVDTSDENANPGRRAVIRR